MFFGDIQTEHVAGAILAHSVNAGGKRLRKGRLLTEDDAGLLREAGIESVVAARLQPGDVHEDEAADRIAYELASPGISLSTAHTGRVNFYAEKPGMLTVDVDTLHRLNRLDESIALGTLPTHRTVAPKQMLATLKIIPFAADEESVSAWLDTAGDADGFLLSLHPFNPLRVVLIQTELPGVKPSVLEKTASVTKDRLAALSGTLISESRCPHQPDALRGEIERTLAGDMDIILIAGASAITDRRDVIPAAVEAAGGVVDHFGMPVDPGNLILTAHMNDADGRAVPIIGLPGCARSPKLNGFDWILRRLFAGLPITPETIMAMGHGGLLKEIATRPLPRADTDQATGETEPATARNIAAVILAAGRSTRMGELNKMLAMIDGKPMVRRVAEAATASDASSVLTVTGHEADRVKLALAALPVKTVENPDFALGLSTSLRAGIAALPRRVDGAIVCLGDMPFLTADILNKLIAAFDPDDGRAICIPTFGGKRGNPVLIARRFFPEIAAMQGDQGARRLIATQDESVCEVTVDDLDGARGILTDIDTPEELVTVLPATD